MWRGSALSEAANRDNDAPSGSNSCLRSPNEGGFVSCCSSGRRQVFFPRSTPFDKAAEEEIANVFHEHALKFRWQQSDEAATMLSEIDCNGVCVAGLDRTCIRVSFFFLPCRDVREKIAAFGEISEHLVCMHHHQSSLSLFFLLPLIIKMDGLLQMTSCLLKTSSLHRCCVAVLSMTRTCHCDEWLNDCVLELAIWRIRWMKMAGEVWSRHVDEGQPQRRPRKRWQNQMIYQRSTSVGTPSGCWRTWTRERTMFTGATVGVHSCCRQRRQEGCRTQHANWPTLFALYQHRTWSPLNVRIEVEDDQMCCCICSMAIANGTLHSLLIGRTVARC